jgi:lysophospholipase L1-like esterase
MTMYRLKNFVGALALALLVPAAALAQVDTGAANFTRYVAIGDSLTAGFMSGSLYETAQRNSYPVLIYRQATGQTAGFEQPLVSDPGLPGGALELRSLVPVVIAPKSGQGGPINLTVPRPYNNLAVPGARLRDTLVTFTGGLHDLVLRPPAFQNTTALQQAMLYNPTFVTIWIGNNDALAAATSGIVIDGVTLTPAAQFETDFRTLVSTLASAQASPRMAMATIPDVTVIPFVNALSRFVPNPATGQPVLINGQPVPLIGPNGLLVAGDRVLLSASSLLAQGIGVPAALGGRGTPLPDTAVLSVSEVATISARVQAYNNVIRAVATERNAALVDTNALLIRAAQGQVGVGGIAFTPAFLTGGIFSYDGVHPTAIGYALIANEFIAAINDKYDAEIPPVNLFPFVFGTSAASSAFAASADLASETPAFLFTEEAKKSLFKGLRIDENPKKPRGKGGKKGGRK